MVCLNQSIPDETQFIAAPRICGAGHTFSIPPCLVTFICRRLEWANAKVDPSVEEHAWLQRWPFPNAQASVCFQFFKSSSPSRTTTPRQKHRRIGISRVEFHKVGPAMIRNIILQLLFVNCAYSVVTQDCLWKDGEAADGYVPCTTDPTATQGTCCHQGDVCLDSGLCYGSVGLVYRGACMSEWSSSGCLTYCDDSK
jgi:hypothetical protein